jgi:hypothetical protein
MARHSPDYVYLFPDAVEHSAELRDLCLNCPRSECTGTCLSFSLLGTRLLDEMRTVIVRTDPDGSVHIHNTIKEAAAAAGVSTWSLSKHLMGDKPSHKCSKWGWQKMTKRAAERLMEENA